MSRQEKLVLLLVALIFITKVGSFGREIVIASLYGASGPSPDQAELWRLLSVVLASLLNVGAAIWIFVEASAAKLRGWVWALLGLLTGLIGVAIYYLAQLYVARSKSVMSESGT